MNFGNICLWNFFSLSLSWLAPAPLSAMFLLVLGNFCRKLLSISPNTSEHEKCVTVNKTRAEDNNLLRFSIFFIFIYQPQHAKLQMKSMQNKLLLKKHISGGIITLYYIGELYHLFIKVIPSAKNVHILVEEFNTK